MSLAEFAIKYPMSMSPERRTVAYEMVLRAIELWKSGVADNLQAQEREKFEAAMHGDGHGALLSDGPPARARTIDNPEARDQVADLGRPASQTLGTTKPMQNPVESRPALPRRIFLVHGHDEGSRESVARFLERLGFDVLILHEQSNQGRTIIEKFEAHGDPGYAVILLTPDDEGAVRGSSLQPRARQNVLLEWGYFLGCLGRKRVCALRKGEVELPSDMTGIVWQALDEHGAWRSKLAQELAAAGFEIDWPKVSR